MPSKRHGALLKQLQLVVDFECWQKHRDSYSRENKYRAKSLLSSVSAWSKGQCKSFEEFCQLQAPAGTLGPASISVRRETTGTIDSTRLYRQTPSSSTASSIGSAHDHAGLGRITDPIDDTASVVQTARATVSRGTQTDAILTVQPPLLCSKVPTVSHQTPSATSREPLVDAHAHKTGRRSQDDGGQTLVEADNGDQAIEAEAVGLEEDNGELATEKQHDKEPDKDKHDENGDEGHQCEPPTPEQTAAAERVALGEKIALLAGFREMYRREKYNNRKIFSAREHKVLTSRMGQLAYDFVAPRAHRHKMRTFVLETLRAAGLEPSPRSHLV